MKGIEFLQHYPQHIIDAIKWCWPWPLLILLGLATVFYAVIGIVRLINHFRLIGADFVFLELKPAAFSDSSPFATEKFFSVLHNMDSTRGTVDKLFGRKIIIPLEIASTKSSGIRYIAAIRKGKETLFRRSIEGYLPDSKLTKVKDYLPKDLVRQGQHIMSLNFRLYRHFCYPLLVSNELAKHDPASYITSTMTQLADKELVTFQLVVTPVKPKEATRIHNKLIRGEEPQLNKKALFWLLPLKLVFLIIKLAMGALKIVLEAIGDATRPSYSTGKVYAPSSYSRSSVMTPEAQSIDDIRNQKLSEPLFQVSIRALVIADSKKEAKVRAHGIIAAMGSYRRPGFQALVSRSSFPTKLRLPYRLFHYTHRLPTLTAGGSCILSSSELAALYHFPHSVSAKTENVVKSLSKELPAPVSLKSNPDLDVILGQNNYHGQITPIGLTEAERERHVYIIGGTGNGKTTMLQYAIVQDILAGKGLAIVDPHGDLAKTILRYIPEERVKDVIYFNPDDIDYPVGMNLLELPRDLKGSELEREKDRLTESVISVFRKIFSDDDTGGSRIEYILRTSIQTALTLKDPTIFTVFKLLINDDFRKEVTNGLPEGTLKDFWANEIGKAGAMQRIKMSHGVTSKIGRFEYSPAAKRVLSQPRSTINFDDILSSSKILICNFSKGALGEDTSALFGTAVLAKLQVAALRRQRLDQSDRTPFHLYVDEFQTFATMPFVQMLSEARKYKLFLTMAEQSTSQQEERRLVNIILANVGTTICFRTGSPLDEDLVLPLFSPYIEPGEIANLPSFTYYIRIAAIQPQEPMSGETLLLDNKGSSDAVTEVLKSSRKLYAKKYVELVVADETVTKSKTTRGKKSVKKKVIKREREPLLAE